MTKEEFLKKLAKKLKILNENEKKDIINEHEALLNEKIKNGQSEEEAVADFGDVNDLAKEILKAYKVDPDYNKNSETLEKTKESFDESVKNAAEWVSEKAQSFFDSVAEEKSDVTLTKIFEIIIKVLIVIILLHILRLPFSLLSSLGAQVFTTAIFPFSLLQYIWIFIIEMLYLATIVITFILIFKNDIFKEKQPTKKTSTLAKKTTKKKTTKKPTAEGKETSANDGVFMLFKIVLILVFVIPLILFSVSLMFSFATLIFLIFHDIFLIGLLLLNVAILGFVFFLIHLFLSLFNNQKPSPWALIPIIIIFILGTIFTIDWALGLSIEKEAKGELTKETIVFTQEEIKDSKYWRQYEIKINPDVDEETVIVEIYFDEKYEKIVDVSETGGVNIYLNSLQKMRDFTNIFIAGLKNDTIYIPYYEIKLSAQEATIQYITD